MYALDELNISGDTVIRTLERSLGCWDTVFGKSDRRETIMIGVIIMGKSLIFQILLSSSL